MANTTYTVGNQTFEVNSAGTIVGGNNNGYGYQYTNSAAPATTTPASTPSIIPTASNNSGGNSSNNTASIIPSAPGASMGTSGNATNALANYANNSAARDAEIARAQAVYQQQAAAGNWDAANAAHDWANQVRNAGGLAGTYNTNTGATLAGITPIANTQPTIIQQPQQQTTQQLLQQYLSMIPQAVNYQAQEYQQTIPSYSITSNPNNTTYIPTLKSKQLWNEQQNQNSDNAYKGYTANMANFAQAYQMLQDSITNAQKEKENEAKTIAERRAEATAAADQKYKEGLLANDTAKTNYDISKPYSTGSGSSGGLTPYQQYQIEQSGNKSEAESQATFNKRVDDLASKSFAEDFSYTLNQWRDAWRIQLLSEME